MDTGPGSGLSDRDKWIWLATGLALLIGLVIAAAVLGGADDGGSERLETADGVLVQVTPDRLQMELADGSRRLTFVVRPEDQRTLDIPHLQLHARDRLATRIYYEREGDELVARRAEDLSGSVAR